MKIISVVRVPGKTFNPRWKSDMQIIKTTEGEYVDNIPNVEFTMSPKGRYGFDWKRYINKDIPFKWHLVQDSGLVWLKKS